MPLAPPVPAPPAPAGARALVSARVQPPANDRGITPAVLTEAGHRVRRRRRPREAAVEPCVSCDPVWEAAYERFETPAQEVRKFARRLRWFGAPTWPRGAHVVELFCGRGNGLAALERLGFNRVTGVDLSSTLLGGYTGAAETILADCRELPLETDAADIIVVQGGLHHLESIPEDLDRVLAEARRVLVPNGRLVVVEPWSTPFLTLVDACCETRSLRRLWGRLDALATMVEHERTTYEQWLAQPDLVRSRLEHSFTPTRARIRWGKLFFLGRAKAI